MISADPNSKAIGKDKGSQLMVALCLNCAVVWRKYAVQWEDGDDHGKKAAQSGGKTNKRKVDDSHREFQLNEINWTATNTDAATTPIGGTPIPQITEFTSVQEPAKKKARGGAEKDPVDPAAIDAGGVNTAGQQKKKLVEKPPGPPPVPELPKPKLLPCAVCLQMEPMGDQHLSCKECRITVHRNCYGVIGETRGLSKWVCDMCANDKNPQVSIVSHRIYIYIYTCGGYTDFSRITNVCSALIGIQNRISSNHLKSRTRRKPRKNVKRIVSNVKMLSGLRISTGRSRKK